jgi:hypothetical protein
MQQRRKTEVPTGPALMAEQVSEFWVWIWSAIDGASDNHERDEAQRLAVAFERAIDRRQFVHDFPFERFIRDQGPVSTALLAHYLLTRIDQWTASKTEGSQRRLRVVTEAARVLGSLLALDARDLVEHFERLGVALEKNSVFGPEVREGVIIESLEEGPALPGEFKARAAEAQARWNARWNAERDRPKKRRQLAEVPR